jgi:hypothetical protein
LIFSILFFKVFLNFKKILQVFSKKILKLSSNLPNLPNLPFFRKFSIFFIFCYLLKTKAKIKIFFGKTFGNLEDLEDWKIFLFFLENTLKIFKKIKNTLKNKNEKSKKMKIIFHFLK